MRSIVTAIALAAIPLSAEAQAREVLPPARQIALAVLPAPAGFREAATVMGYRPDGQLVRLRLGDNGIICLADDPREARFHASCYHESLEPFMRRGREIRTQHGPNKRELTDSLRLRDIRAGRIRMPANAVLYQIFAADDSVDVAAATIKSPSYLDVVYMPGATTRTTGISTDAMRGTPWLMYPGKPWAHIMIVR
ncbi:MAG TPA: hypothetical protein VMY38_06090 [Gemmatimonadaceae bacterium]|nr:hypothetical protein [Gemmatimonadaceae bacterium]